MKYLGQIALIVLLCAVHAIGQEKKIKEVPVKLSGTIDGAQLYTEFCAVCHGTNGKGRGPAAEALKRPPTDLTRLASKNGGKYPELAVQRKIKGNDIIEHGTAEMPIWGTLLVGPGGTKADADIRIYNLVKYLEQIQAK
jgi:hypothetical protein